MRQMRMNLIRAPRGLIEFVSCQSLNNAQPKHAIKKVFIINVFKRGKEQAQPWTGATKEIINQRDKKPKNLKTII